MKSLFIDENGFLFHKSSDERFGVGLIKSPGLAEVLYAELEFDSDGELIKTAENEKTAGTISLLRKFNLFGSHTEPDV